MSIVEAKLVAAVREHSGLDVFAVEPVNGGYDVTSESWRVDTTRGPFVVRVDRAVSVATAEWLGDVVHRAVEHGVACSAPVMTLDGRVAMSLHGYTVTVRRFVEGVPINRDEPSQIAAAGAALATLHRALAGWAQERPEPSPWAPVSGPAVSAPAALHDPELDAWFDLRNAACRTLAEPAENDYSASLQREFVRLKDQLASPLFSMWGRN